MTAKRLTCVEFVELATDYIESELPPAERCRVDRHLASCDGCSTYLDQLRRAIRLTATLGQHDVDATARDRMLRAFHSYRPEVQAKRRLQRADRPRRERLPRRATKKRTR